MSDIVTAVQHNELPVMPARIKLERGQKGGYGWEISFSGITLGECERVISACDLNLRRVYGAAEK